jgi:hypothetical protein
MPISRSLTYHNVSLGLARGKKRQGYSTRSKMIRRFFTHAAVAVLLLASVAAADLPDGRLDVFLFLPPNRVFTA